jgi:hypothetical protein
VETQLETNRRLKEPVEAPEEFWEGLRAVIPQPPPPASGVPLPNQPVGTHAKDAL